MWEVNGLPAHVLLVHGLVVLVPVTSLAVVAAAWSTRVRRRLGLVTPLLGAASLVLTPITTNAGEWLQDQLPPAPLIKEHADLGGQLWPWALGLFVVALVIHVLGRRTDTGIDVAPGRAALAVAVLASVVAVGATVQTVRIGESGSRAVWEGSV